MEKKFIKTDLAPSAVGTYSQGVEWNGMILFSGQIGIDPQTSTLVEGFNDIDGLLKSQDLTREHILKTSIFMTDLGLFSKVNEVYENYFSAPFPARSCIQVPALPKGALIEIEVIAARKIS